MDPLYRGSNVRVAGLTHTHVHTRSLTENEYVVIRISELYCVLHTVKTSEVCEDRLRQGYA